MTLHFGRQPKRFRPKPAPRRVKGSGPGWYRGDCHLHTVHSDGRHTQRSLLALAREQALTGATISLVLVDIRPNRPTFAQLAAQPGLDGMRSKSIGGATIEGEVILADGTRYPVRYDWYSSSLAEVRGFTTWQDASHAFDRFARRLATGRLAG